MTTVVGKSAGSKRAEISERSALLAWNRVREAGIGPIHNDDDYARMHKMMNRLLDIVGDNETHPLADLLETIATLIDSYEQRKLGSTLDIAPRDVLKFLMEQHGVKQSDLSEELGTQSVASEILSGKREINARQARALAHRFNVSPAVFI